MCFLSDSFHLFDLITAHLHDSFFFPFTFFSCGCSLWLIFCSLGLDFYVFVLVAVCVCSSGCCWNKINITRDGSRTFGQCFVLGWWWPVCLLNSNWKDAMLHVDCFLLSPPHCRCCSAISPEPTSLNCSVALSECCFVLLVLLHSPLPCGWKLFFTSN